MRLHSCRSHKTTLTRSWWSHKTTTLTFMAVTQNNCDCTHPIYTQSKTPLALMSHTHHTSPISPPTIALKPYKTKRFYGKIARFSIVFIRKQQLHKRRATGNITSVNHTKTHPKPHVKNTFKTQNYTEERTVIGRSVQKHRKTVKHSKFFYKN